jgi:hypothetical protein
MGGGGLAAAPLFETKQFARGREKQVPRAMVLRFGMTIHQSF